jgi:predicted 3-demethylubiquinone-9 3-methyltransferase (glyoxalase superfamily)
MPQITPFLWFDGKAEEATDFYLSIFRTAKVVDIMPDPCRCGDGRSIRT